MNNDPLTDSLKCLQPTMEDNEDNRMFAISGKQRRDILAALEKKENKMIDFLKKFTSRKFLTSVAAEIALLVSLFKGDEVAGSVENVIIRVGTIAGMIIVAVGYVVVEGRVDESAIIANLTEDEDEE